MEPFKFRAWDNKGKCMLDWLCITQTAFNRLDQHGRGLMYTILTNQATAQDDFGFVVMPYSGLHDSNDNPIYAGDLVKLTDQYIYEVRFEDGKFVGYHLKQEWGRWGDLKRLSDPDFSHRHHEVIGNIFAHPHLLTPTIK
jgi:hypothetical protein